MWDNISERAEMVYGKPSVVPRLTKPSDGWFTVPETKVMIALERHDLPDTTKTVFYALLAQLVEQETFNFKVVGSIPTGGTFWDGRPTAESGHSKCP